MQGRRKTFEESFFFSPLPCPAKAIGDGGTSLSFKKLLSNFHFLLCKI